MITEENWLLGHLRYGTSGEYGSTTCHPYFRKSNWHGKNLMVAGNFNLTNVDELNRHLVERGQHPVFDTDTQAILEETGYHLDSMNDLLAKEALNKNVTGKEHINWIGERIKLDEIFVHRLLTGMVDMHWQVSWVMEMLLLFEIP